MFFRRKYEWWSSEHAGREIERRTQFLSNIQLCEPNLPIVKTRKRKHTHTHNAPENLIFLRYFLLLLFELKCCFCSFIWLVCFLKNWTVFLWVFYFTVWFEIYYVDFDKRWERGYFSTESKTLKNWAISCARSSHNNRPMKCSPVRNCL